MAKNRGQNIWKDIECIELSELDSSKQQLSRYSLISLNQACGDKLPLGKFNLDYYRSRIIVSDNYSFQDNMRGLFDTPIKAKEKEDGSGWIYLYTNEQELNNGKLEGGWLWWYSIKYKCRIKIGRTGRHPIQRIREQQSAGVAHLPLILGLLWTPTIGTADTVLRNVLKSYKARNSGGDEWYLIEPSEALKIVVESIENCRNKVPNSEVAFVEENF
jgi:T5orf172 domain